LHNEYLFYLYRKHKTIKIHQLLALILPRKFIQSPVRKIALIYKPRKNLTLFSHFLILGFLEIPYAELTKQQYLLVGMHRYNEAD